MFSPRGITNAIKGDPRAGVEPPPDGGIESRYSPAQFARSMGGLLLLIAGATLLGRLVPAPVIQLLAMLAGVMFVIGWPRALAGRLRDADRPLWPVYAVLTFIVTEIVVSFALRAYLARSPNRLEIMDQYDLWSGLLYLAVFAATAFAWRLPTRPSLLNSDPAT